MTYCIPFTGLLDIVFQPRNEATSTYTELTKAPCNTLNKAGQKELAIAPIDGTVLEGVTRDSILSLTREQLVPKRWTVSERMVWMAEVVEAAEDGTLIEVFGCGITLLVSPVQRIGYKGKGINIVN